MGFIGLHRLTSRFLFFSKKENKEKYPGTLQRIVYYAEELHRSFVYYTNNFYLSAKDIALLYKYRWQVELSSSGSNSTSKSSVSGVRIPAIAVHQFR